MPFDRTNSVNTAPAQTKALAMQPPVKSATTPPVQPATPSPAPTPVVKSKPRRSTYSEADLVAEDTVIRYGKRAATPEQPGKSQASK